MVNGVGADVSVDVAVIGTGMAFVGEMVVILSAVDFVVIAPSKDKATCAAFSGAATTFTAAVVTYTVEDAAEPSNDNTPILIGAATLPSFFVLTSSPSSLSR